MKIAIAQINATIGDIEGNTQKISLAIEKASQEHCDILLAPELALLGYPPRDLLFRANLIKAQEQALKSLARQCRKIALYIGWAKPIQGPGKALANCASLIHQGRFLATHQKVLLPYYDIFDEGRYFEPGRKITLVKFKGYQLALSICEDIWNDKNFNEPRLHQNDPLTALRARHIDLILNVSASPFWQDKQSERSKRLGLIAKTHQSYLAYANFIGGNDEIIFDGSSCLFSPKGQLLAQAASFQEGLIISDLASKSAQSLDRTSKTTTQADIYRALVLGVKDYFQKCGFKKAVLGLSGGIDSALVACIAADALGPSSVYGVSLPSRYSSSHSLEDAAVLAKNLGIDYKTIPIEPVFKSYLSVFKSIFPGLAPNIAEENIQARIRGSIIMAISNKLGHMALATGNKSELAMGYCTLYGDLNGGLAPISDLPKTLVYKLAHWRNRQGAVIPARTLTKAPSAELRPNQKDQDTLPPYDLLDQILESYIVKSMEPENILKHYPKEIAQRVMKSVDINEFKRRQAPPGLKITRKAFGSGRRMPIACRVRF